MTFRLPGLAYGFAAAMALATPVAAAGADAQSVADRQAFLGIWEGVDPLDGSTVMASITDVRNDGVLEMVQTESFFTYCARLGANYSLGRGMITGDGPVVRKRVRFAGGNAIRRVFEVVTSFTCFRNNGVPRAPLVGPFDYFLVQEGRVLVVPGADAQTPDVLLYRSAR
jgi:hypothetical protein